MSEAFSTVNHIKESTLPSRLKHQGRQSRPLWYQAGLLEGELLTLTYVAKISVNYVNY